MNLFLRSLQLFRLSICHSDVNFNFFNSTVGLLFLFDSRDYYLLFSAIFLNFKTILKNLLETWCSQSDSKI